MGNWWENQCIFHGVGDTIELESDGKKYPYFVESMGTNFPGKLMGKPMHLPCDEVYYRMGIWLEKCTHTTGKVWVPISQACPRVLLLFPVLWEIDGEIHAFLIRRSIPQDGNWMGKKYPYYGKSMSSNFPGPPHTMGFVAFSRTVGNWWENPWISHMMKYTMDGNQMGKKVPILWEKFDYQFPRFSPYDGFCCIFTYCGKLMGKLMHFPYNEVYHGMGIGWEKSTHTMGKVWLPISQVFLMRWVLLHIFQYYGKSMRKPMHFSYDEVYHRMRIWMENITHIYGKSMITNFPGSPMRWVLLHFPILWKIDGKTQASFPISWDSLIFSCECKKLI